MKWTKETVRFVILRTIGNFLVLFSLWGMAMTFGPALYLEVLYRYNQARNIRYVVAEYVPARPAPSISPQTPAVPTRQPLFPTPTDVVPDTFFGQLTGGNSIEFLSPVSAEFGIIIPKIGANAPILPNVDAGIPGEYLPALQKGVAHAAGTVFPGVSGNIFLFAHSTDAFWNIGRYNAIFFLLKELDKGDEIDVFFQGKRHIYRVVNTMVVDPSQTQYLTDRTPYEQLTLQTCWPPGTTLQRLLVVARPEADIE